MTVYFSMPISISASPPSKSRLLGGLKGIRMFFLRLTTFWVFQHFRVQVPTFHSPARFFYLLLYGNVDDFCCTVVDPLISSVFFKFRHIIAFTFFLPQRLSSNTVSQSLFSLLNILSFLLLYVP